MSKSHRHNTITAFFTMLPIWIMAIATSLFFSECGEDKQANIPRQEAFPRIETHDSTFTELPSAPMRFEISTEAKVVLDSVNTGKKMGENSRWFTISYPRYDAEIYYTFTPVNSASLDKVIDNRTERMKLNSGGLTSELLELTNANGFSSQILTTIESKVTPIQFISTDNKHWVVSGAVHIKNHNSNNIDSISPVINVIKRDIIHSLKTIKI